MGALPEPKPTRWPFFAADILMLGIAFAVYHQSKTPLTGVPLAIAAFSVCAGCIFGILPFVLEYRMAARLAEIAGLSSALEQVKQLEKIAGQISDATGSWNSVQKQASDTAAAAGAIAERMATEMKGFSEFMQKMNEDEKGMLRLELEKLRRAQSDWLQVLVRVLDHVYALHQGAVRSGQPNLVEQLTNFQNACRDAARRIGLTPFTPEAAEPFDVQRHQLVEGDGQSAAGAAIGETVASGYTYQGKLLRPALVRLANGAPA